MTEPLLLYSRQYESFYESFGILLLTLRHTTDLFDQHCSSQTDCAYQLTKTDTVDCSSENEVPVDTIL